MTAVSSGFEFEVVGAAAGGALISGALAVLAPYLASLTAALAALALAGWVASRTSRPFPRALGRPGWFALASLAVGAWIFLAPPAPVDAVRGLALGVAVVPLWWVSRSGGR